MENTEKTYKFYRKNALLITEIHKAAELYRKQFYGSAGILVNNITAELGQLESFPQYVNPDSFKNGVFNIISSLLSDDFVRCADSLDAFIYEVMIPVQQALFDELNGYIFDIYESMIKSAGGVIDLGETPSGYTTLLYHSDKDRYLCSTDDPMTEAYHLAGESFSPESNEYHIWGMGLGYHAYALYQVTNGSADIYIYDNDPFLFDLAVSGKLGSWQSVFEKPVFHFIEDRDITKFPASLSNENAKFLIHMPSLNKLSETDVAIAEKKTVLKKIQITLNSFSEKKKDLYINFYKNLKYADGYAEELFPEFEGKTVVLIAAGPSLDKNIDELKNALDNGAPVKVICVGTVFRKLIKAGIAPDIFCIMDPDKRTYVQIEGCEDQTIPLIINTTAYYEVSQNYQGKKYIACQKDFELSEKLGHRLFNTGGSVTTLALDFAIQAKAKNVIMLGCDMAYTGNVTHSEGTAQYHSAKEAKVIYVKGYYGDTVPTGLLLSIYKSWIENRLKGDDTAGTEFINSTEGGAFIEGMKHISLKEALLSI